MPISARGPAVHYLPQTEFLNVFFPGSISDCIRRILTGVVHISYFPPSTHAFLLDFDRPHFGYLAKHSLLQYVSGSLRIIILATTSKPAFSLSFMVEAFTELKRPLGCIHRTTPSHFLTPPPGPELFSPTIGGGVSGPGFLGAS